LPNCGAKLVKKNDTAKQFSQPPAAPIRRQISNFAFAIHNLSIKMRTHNELDSLALLGAGATKYPTDYDPSLLETFENKHPENDYLVTLHCPEFTSLCPKTGQPDFAKIVISYIPDRLMVESKSLKLYLFSFRNHGDFHEDCVNIIMKDLVKLMNPRYIEVKGIFTPRGGIAIHPFANHADERHSALAGARLSAAMQSAYGC